MITLIVGVGGDPLPATIIDDAGNLADPESILVNIYDSAGVQRVTSGVPAHPSLGSYTYTYVPPVGSVIGQWTIRWLVTLNGEIIEATEQFTVLQTGPVGPPATPVYGTFDPMVADRIYASLGPMTREDVANSMHLWSLVRAIATMLVEVELLVRDKPSGPGWSGLMDPDVAPVNAFGWLAQFVGVDLLNGLTDAQQRQRIKETTGFARGTLASIEGAARQTLTGRQHVIVFERDTSAYHLIVRTYLNETPDPVLTEAVIRSLKPAGLVLVFQVVAGGTYAQLDTAFGTYTDMDTALTNYDAQTLWIP